MKLKVVDDYGDAGFGGHWAIAICEGDGFETGDYLGDFRGPEWDAAVNAALPFAHADSGRAVVFSSQKRARKGLAASREALAGKGGEGEGDGK